MTGHLVLADRVRKARRTGRCAPGGCRIAIGDRIGLLPGTGWAAVACIIARQRRSTGRTAP